MNEQQATMIAEVLGGETWQSGGDIWIVLLRRGDGHIVAISDEVVNEYAGDGALEANEPAATILLH